MNFVRNTQCLVIRTYDNKLLCSVDDELYELRKLELSQSYSKEFDLEPTEKVKKYASHIPPMTHPWKHESYMNYLLASKRTEKYALENAND